MVSLQALLTLALVVTAAPQPHRQPDGGVAPLPYDELDDSEVLNDVNDFPHNDMPQNDDDALDLDDELDDSDDFENRNPAFTESGDELVEGDLVLTAEQRDSRQALMTKLWTSPVSFALSAEMELRRDRVLAGIQHWRDHTCLEFNEVAIGATEPHIYFIEGSGCWSFVGKSRTTGGQVVSIGARCGGLNTVVHEIAHAMGVYHEQMRTDRNSYVRINYENIVDGKSGNFVIKLVANNLSVPYDLTSVMHYGSKAFTKNGLKTISVLDVQYEHIRKRQAGFSHRDKHLVNAMYSCAAQCVDPPTCQNGGFVGKDCTCVCPDNTEGVNCGTMTEPYYGELDCGDVDMRAPGYITSPNFPNRYPTSLFCYWIITAPDDQRVQVTFHYMQLENRNSRGKCGRNHVDLRYSGDLYSNTQQSCGTELTAQSYTSTDNQFLVKFKSGNRYRFTGFNATVEFVPADSTR